MDQTEFKKRILRLFKSPVLLALIIFSLLDIFLAFQSGNRDFIYRPARAVESAFDEHQPLYAKLDPHLGYTFVKSFAPSSRDVEKFLLFDQYDSVDQSLDGYLTYSFDNQQKPIVIAAYGNCSTDGHMFKGNWPWQLHLLLKEKNIAHVIYNGGVSGYNSFQEFLKISRDIDLLPKRVDLVVNFDAAGDAGGNDSVAGFYSVNQYQLELLSQMTNQPSSVEVYGFFPNVRKFFRENIYSYFQPSNLNYSLGLAGRDPVFEYKRNIQNIEILLKAKGIQFLHYRQVADFDRSEKIYPSSEERNDLKKQFARTEVFLKETDLQFRDLKYSRRVDEILNDNRKLYYLPGDPNLDGQRKMAQSILEFINSSGR